MTAWKTGLLIAPVLIISMALLLHRKRAMSRGALIFASAVTIAITALMLSM